MGAGLSLILAGSVALSLVSALIAFNGWPGVTVQRTADERALVAQVSRDRAPEAAPTAVVLASAPRPRPTSVAAPFGRVVKASASPKQVVPTIRPAAKQPARPVIVSARPAAAAVADPPPAPKRKAAKKPLAPVGQAVTNLGGVLDGTVNTVGGVVNGLVKPILPAVGKTVQDATAVVGTILKQLTAGLGGTVAGIGATAAPAATDVVPPATGDAAAVTTP